MFKLNRVPGGAPPPGPPRLSMALPYNRPGPTEYQGWLRPPRIPPPVHGLALQKTWPYRAPGGGGSAPPGPHPPPAHRLALH